MKYEKPEVVRLGPAITAVRGNHKHGGPLDLMPSTPAYEADE
ncbi:MAG: hypothetical protein WBC04_20055 [Candidatus Acidiferrales bacterium]